MAEQTGHGKKDGRVVLDQFAQLFALPPEIPVTVSPHSSPSTAETAEAMVSTADYSFLGRFRPLRNRPSVFGLACVAAAPRRPCGVGLSLVAGLRRL